MWVAPKTILSRKVVAIGVVKPKLVELYRGCRNPVNLSSYVEQEMSAMMMRRNEC